MGTSCVRWTADTERAFLFALRLTGQVQRAAAAIGRSTGVCYQHRDRFPAFAAAWADTLAEMERERLDAAGAATGAAEGEDAPAPALRTRRDGWTQQRQRAYCRALADTGTFAAAAARVGISRDSAIRLRRRSPEFRAACERALADGAPTPEEAALLRAVDGWDDPVFQGGKLVGHRRRFSDSLLAVLLRRGERQQQATERRNAGRVPEATMDDVRHEMMKRLRAMNAARQVAERSEQLAWCERMERGGNAP